MRKTDTKHVLTHGSHGSHVLQHLPCKKRKEIFRSSRERTVYIIRSLVSPCLVQRSSIGRREGASFKRVR